MLHRDQYISRVRINQPLCREHFRLVLNLDAFPPTAPGQFIQIACRDLDRNYSPEVESDWIPGQRLDQVGQELMSRLALLRRPFSLADRRDVNDGVELEIIHRVIGTGTEWLSHLRQGDRVNILGPLGNSFMPPKLDQTAVLVGGGVGIPPMLYLARHLAKSGRNVVAFAGATSLDLLPLTVSRSAGVGDAEGVAPEMIVEEFTRCGAASVVTTDDGSFGFRGFVTQALERYLDSVSPPNAVIYTCGPEAMMKRVAAIALSRRLPCQIAVERAMACGMGTCQSCVIRVRDDGGNRPGLSVEGPEMKRWRYRLACTDGPVFEAADLLW
jgi:dihydroorotate dehydrogenase electron transfer subunit